MNEATPAPPKKKAGRKFRFTPELREKFLSLIKRGLPQGQCCAVIGLSPTTLWNAKTRDPAFRADLEKATALGIDARLRVIERASKKGDWRASAWLLERLHPEHFGSKSRDPGQPVAVGVKIILPRKDEEPATIQTTSDPKLLNP